MGGGGDPAIYASQPLLLYPPHSLKLPCPGGDGVIVRLSFCLNWRLMVCLLSIHGWIVYISMEMRKALIAELCWNSRDHNISAWHGVEKSNKDVLAECRAFTARRSLFIDDGLR